MLCSWECGYIMSMGRWWCYHPGKVGLWCPLWWWCVAVFVVSLVHHFPELINAERAMTLTSYKYKLGERWLSHRINISWDFGTFVSRNMHLSHTVWYIVYHYYRFDRIFIDDSKHILVNEWNLWNLSLQMLSICFNEHAACQDGFFQQ